MGFFKPPWMIRSLVGTSALLQGGCGVLEPQSLMVHTVDDINPA